MMSRELIVKYPENLPDLLQRSPSEFEEEARMAMVVKLYELGRISSGMAADIVGLDRVTFLLQLHKYNVSAVNYDPSELESDLQNA